MKLGKILIAALVLIPPAVIEAREPDVSQLGPKIIEEPGQPVRYVFKDGREARLAVGNSKIITAWVPIDITENLCVANPVENPKCRLKLSIRIAGVSLRWAIHPDSSKIGKVISLKIANMDFKEELQRLSFLQSGYQQFFPLSQNDLGPIELECQDFRWISGVNSSSAPKEIKVLRWETGTMKRNPETGMMDNEVSGGFIGGIFKKKSEQIVLLDRVKTYTAYNGGLNYISDGEVALHFNSPATDGAESSACQTTLKANLEMLGDIRSEINALRPVYQEYVPGRPEQEEIWNLNSIYRSVFHRNQFLTGNCEKYEGSVCAKFSSGVEEKEVQ